MHVSTAQSSPLGLELRPLRWFLDGKERGRYLADLVELLPYAAGFVLLYGLLVATGFFVSTVPTAAVAIWPAVGLLCAVLASTVRRTWPLWIASFLVGRLLFEWLIIDNRSVIAPLTFSVVNAIEAVFFATLMQKPLIQSYRQGRPLYLSITMTSVAILAANIGGVLGALAISALNFDVFNFWTAWRVWAAGDFVGMILVTPIAVWLMLPQIRIRRGLAGHVEHVAMFVSQAGLIGLAVYLAPKSVAGYAGVLNLVLAACLVLPVLWAAFRAEFPVVAALQMLLAIGIVTASSYRLGPFGHDVAGYLPALAAMQLFLVATVIVVTTVTFAVLERQRAQEESNLHQRFSDVTVLLTNKLFGAGDTTIDKVITDSLQLIGEFAKADRSVLVQLDDSTQSISTTHRWVAEGVTEQSPKIDGLELDKFPWVVEQFYKKGYVILKDLDKPLPSGANELEPIRKAVPDTKSVVYVALFADERLIGAIGFAYLKSNMQFSEELISFTYLVGQLFANILQRKRTEQALDLYRNKLRTLTRDIAMTEERARRRTAIDLHDGIGQNLAVARMKVGQLLTKSGDDKAELVQLRNLVDDALRGTRFIISDLSPSILYELGLVPALQSLAERFELANNVTCLVEESGESWESSHDMRISVYRAVQECLNNVGRHAQAESVRITINWSSERLNIDVIDDGIGFDAPQDPGSLQSVKGFGLFSLRESIVLQGGTVDIESASGIGTSVKMSVPRHDRDDGE